MPGGPSCRSSRYSSSLWRPLVRGYGRGINLSSMVGLSDSPQPGARSLGKMLELLNVFTTAAPAWSTEDLIRFSGTSRSTCYRYIKTLQGAGFLTPVAGGAWMLGPRI